MSTVLYAQGGLGMCNIQEKRTKPKNKGYKESREPRHIALPFQQITSIKEENELVIPSTQLIKKTKQEMNKTCVDCTAVHIIKLNFER